MAKFCNKCGAQLDDSAQICGFCGAPLDVAPAPAPAKKAAGGALLGTVKGFLTPARLKIGAIALAGVAVLIVLIIIISSFTGVNGLQRKIIKTIEKGDSKTLSKIYSQLLMDKDESRDWDKYFDEYFDGRDEDVKISAKIVETHDYSSNEYKEFLERSGFSKNEISKVRKCIVKVKYKKNGGFVYEYKEFTLVKEKKGWRVYSGSFR